MKQVVKHTPKQYLTSRDADRTHSYGIFQPCGIPEKSKGFITTTQYGGPYIPRSAEKVTIGDEWAAYQSHNLRIVIDTLINDGFEVYAFSTPKELFAWLAE